MHTFTTTDTEHRSRNGATVEIVRTITEPDATHSAEVLPMYVVRFEDGHTIEAFADELVPAPTAATTMIEATKRTAARTQQARPAADEAIANYIAARDAHPYHAARSAAELALTPTN